MPNDQRYTGAPQSPFSSSEGPAPNWSADQALMQAVMETASDILLVLDEHALIRYVSPSVERILKDPPASLIGRCALGEFPPEDAGEVAGRIRHVLQGGEVQSFELRLQENGGPWHWFEARGRPFTSSDGARWVLVCLTDITERKRAVERLCESESLYRTLAESARDFIFVIGADGLVKYVNDFSARAFGCRPKDMIGRPRTSLFPPDTARQQAMSLGRVFQTGEPINVRDRTVFPQGPLWLDSWLIPLKDAAGTVYAVLGMSRDITAEVKAQEAIRQTRDFLETMMNSMTNGVFVLDESGRFTHINRYGADLLGYRIEELVGASYESLLPPEKVDAARQQFARAFAEKAPVTSFETEVVTRDRRRLSMVIGGVPLLHDGKVIRLVGTAVDVTASRRAEEALRSSEARLRLVTGQLPLILWTTDNQLQINHMVGAGLGKLHLDASAYVGQRVYELQPRNKGSRDQVVNAHVCALSGRGVTYEYPLGDTVLESHLEPLRDDNGTIIGVIGLSVDVTARKQTEQALRQSQRLLQKTFEGMHEGILIINSASREIVDCNPAACAIFGSEKHELVGKSARTLTAEGVDPEEFGRTIREALDTRGFYYAPEVALRRRDGTPIQIELTILALESDEGTTMGEVAILRDIGGRRKLQDEVIRAQRLESLGVLAGGIAHDFNNILTAIQGSLSQLRTMPDLRGEGAELVVDALKASVEAQKLTQQLLTFARGGLPIREIASVGDTVRESASLIMRGSNARCRFEIPHDLWPAEIDRGQFGQVIGNLVLNAVQAMPHGGTVTVRCANVAVPQTGPKPLPWMPPGRYVCTTVSDTGLGIPPQIISKIFDPYFTTKPNGSGLGLATCHSVITKHDGYITVDSAESKGSTFSVYLPAAEGEVVAERLKTRRIYTGTGRILLMDDDPIIRNICGRILRQLGYDPTTADRGEEVLSLYEEAAAAGRPFRAVILDLTIRGGLGGEETLRRLKQMDPNVRAIVSSGYCNDPIMSDYLRYGFAGVVAKPYQIEEFSKVIHEVLDGKSAGAAGPG